MRPIEGVDYVASDLGAVIEIAWFSNKKEDWASVLSFVRSIEGRKFDPISKRWQVPNNESVRKMLTDSGWFSGKPSAQKGRPKMSMEAKRKKNLYKVPRQFRDAYTAEEVLPTYDPEERQRQSIDGVVLDDSRNIIPGLRDYQVDFLKFAQHRNGRVALGDDMGTGKTLQSLAWLVYADDFPAIIVVNAPTKLQWKQEYRKWLSKVKGCPTRVQVLKGQKPYRIEDGVSVIINWDILGYWADYLGKMGFKLLIGDEAQAIGNPKSKRSKAFISLSKKVRDCIVMSGTPARSKPAQFWTMLNITDPDTFPSYEEYLYRYCDPTWTPFSALPVFKGADRVKELHSFICNCMIRRTKDDVMKSLPAKTMQVVPLEVDESGMAEYEAMESEIGNIGDSKKAMREHVAGLMHTAYTLKEDSLIRWVTDFLDSGEKLLLFAWHRDVVDIIADKLKDYRPAKIYGGLTDKVRENEKQKFITDPSCRVCVANIQAGGVGIDGFQNVCSNVAFAEFSHTPTDHRQAEDRLHRGGQCRAVTSYYLVATGTIDEEAVEILDERAKMLDGILDGKEACDIDLLSEILARHGVSV